MQKKLVQLNTEYCTKKSINLSKLTTLSKYKKEPKREQYIKSLTRSEASIIFKLRTRMLNLKNNFRNNTNGDILCPRCHKEIDNKQHLFERCIQLEDLYRKYKIKSYEEIFESKTKIGRLKETADLYCSIYIHKIVIK